MSDEATIADVQRADKRARQTAIVVILCGTLAGLVLLWVAESQMPALEAWVVADRAELSGRLRATAAIVALAFGLPALLMAAYLWHLGRRIIRDDRFPPVNIRVIRDVIVVRGAAARRRGRVLQVIAAVFVLAALGFVVSLWRLISSLGF